MTERYEVGIAGWTDRFEVHVNKTRSAMVRHAREVYRADGYRHFDFNGQTEAMVHPYKFPEDLYAIAFFNREDLGEHATELIAHEAVHLAMARERFVSRFGMNYDAEDWNTDEERLAQLVGKIVWAITEALVKRRAG